MRTLLIDNHDSYTYNLFHLIADTYGVRPTVLTNDSPAWVDVCLDDFDAIIISPGPGHPQQDRDVGHAPEAVLTGGLPVLGVCLGHQMLAWLTGGRVVPAPQPRHGHIGQVRHAGDDLFADIPDRFSAVRYHSLCVAEPLPAELVATAWAEDGVVMALRHRERPWFGVQFHPESVATEYGAALLRSFRRAVERWRGPSTVHGDVAPEEHPRRVDIRDHGCAHVRQLDHAVGTESAFERLFAGSRYAFWLDSSRVEAGMSRWSFLGDAGPAGAAGTEILRAEVGAGQVEVLDSDGRT
ncbi:MAG: aminodeoxychorismate/anthranilate synthase component II, partial [Actinobacteria bacterium]|nr:aminodeoxychorismate/anthranilate synthase component II [Actinomycetota bacterium]